MKSMTAFGFGEYQDEKLQVSLTLKSYNNRFQDILVYLPPHLSRLEPKFREFLSARIQRGRVELYVKIIEFEENPLVIPDKNLALGYIKALQELSEAAGIREKVRLSHLLRVEGILKIEKKQDLKRFWRIIKGLLDSTFQDYEEMRVKEGRATEDDIRKLLTEIGARVDEISGHSSLIETKIKEDLRERFYDLLGNDIDETRILAETAVMLVKHDINEEVVRIRSHINIFSEVMEEKKAVGKKLDFICQEINREVNTIGSKILLFEVNNAVVSLKDSLEKIREQLRNVE